MAPVHWAAGSDGETNFGLTSLAAPNAASSSVARYSFVARLTACASSSLFHCEPGVDRCLLASATIRLASTAKPLPPTRPAPMHAPTRRSNTLRKMSLLRNRSLRAREKPSDPGSCLQSRAHKTSDRQGSLSHHGTAPAPIGSQIHSR